MTVKPLEVVVYEAVLNAVRSYPTKHQAAIALGITHKTLYNKLVKYKQRGWAVQ